MRDVRRSAVPLVRIFTDSIALIHYKQLPRRETSHDPAWHPYGEVAVGGTDWAVAVVEVKPAVSRPSLDPMIVEVTGDVRAM